MATKPGLTKERKAWVASLTNGDWVWTNGPHGHRHAGRVCNGRHGREVDGRPLTTGGSLEATYMSGQDLSWIEPMSPAEQSACEHDALVSKVQMRTRRVFCQFHPPTMTAQDIADLNAVLDRLEKP